MMECKTDGQTRELKAARCPQNNQILRIKTVHDYIKRMQWYTVFVYPVFVYTYFAQKTIYCRDSDRSSGWSPGTVEYVAYCKNRQPLTQR